MTAQPDQDQARMSRFLKVTLGVVVTGFFGYFLVVHLPEIRGNVSRRDSLAYWAAARLLRERYNPYDPRLVLELEQQSGYAEPQPLILRTPPWSLFMVLPLAPLSPFWAWVLWSVMTVSCLLVAMRLGRRMYGGSRGGPDHLLTLAGYTFAPVAACLISGQMGLMLALGIVLFLWWEKKYPFVAGAALILPFAKPHLLALFWIIAALWAALQKRWQLAVGFVSALGVATAVAIILDPPVFQHYCQMVYAASIQNEFIPALSGVVRLIFFRRRFWVQFLPLAVGLAWSLIFFRRWRSVWNWQVHGPALLVVSVLTTPYGWLADETVLLPAILQAAAFIYQARTALKVGNKIAISVLVLLDVLLLLILRARIPFSTGIYFWSSLVWFFWYFSAHRLRMNAAGQGEQVVW